MHFFLMRSRPLWYNFSLDLHNLRKSHKNLYKNIGRYKSGSSVWDRHGRIFVRQYHVHKHGDHGDVSLDPGHSHPFFAYNMGVAWGRGNPNW